MLSVNCDRVNNKKKIKHCFIVYQQNNGDYLRLGIRDIFYGWYIAIISLNCHGWHADISNVKSTRNKRFKHVLFTTKYENKLWRSIYEVTVWKLSLLFTRRTFSLVFLIQTYKGKQFSVTNQERAKPFEFLGEKYSKLAAICAHLH